MVAMRLGAGGLLVPFAFVIDDSLLFQHGVGPAILPFLFAVAGLFAVAVAFVGFVVRPVGILWRVVLFFSGLALVWPNLVTGMVGGAVLLAAMLWHFLRNPEAGSPPQPLKIG